MFITYYTNMPKPEVVQCTIPRYVLNSDIQDYLSKQNIQDSWFYIQTVGSFTFLYNDSDDRIDIREHI